MATRVRGIESVNLNFKRVSADIVGRRSEGAVYAIVSQVGAAAATMTPIDTSTLINSQYTEVQSKDGAISGRSGYTAAYAGAVHEASGKLAGTPRANGNGDYWSPNASPKFLEKGADLIKPSIPAILKAVYKS